VPRQGIVVAVVAMLRALGVGDLLTAVPALRALARAFPRDRRVLLAPRRLEPLVALLGAAAPEIADTPTLDARLPLEAHRAGIAVNLHGHGPKSHRLLLEGRPERLLAFAAPGLHDDGPAWHRGEHEVIRWCRLLIESGIPANPADLALDPSSLAGAGGNGFHRGATIIHPGAASAARRWPVERWARVARAERDAGRDVVVTGGVGELGLAGALAHAAGLPADAVLAGRTSLDELAMLVASAGRVVCGDTGIAHLATALGTPSVVIFGPTSPAEWGPPSHPRHRVLWAGRRGDPQAPSADPGLLAIQPGHVLDALAALPVPAPA
jgi:ADP-heptose:LPS heptosyltransferase